MNWRPIETAIKDGMAILAYPQEPPVPDVAQSATPEERLDQVFLAAFGTNDPAMLDWVAVKFRLKELTAAMAERDEARETLDLMCDEFQRIKALAGLPLEAHTFCERAISGIKQRVPLIEQRDKAEKERAEARRLLGEAKASLIRTAYWMAEQTGADEPPYPEPENFCACNHCTEYGELLTLLSRVEQITNHLKTA